MLTSIYIMAQTWAIMLKNKIASFFVDEKGNANVVSVVVILAIVLALVVVFRTQITNLFDNLWGDIWEDAEGIGDYQGKYK